MPATMMAARIARSPVTRLLILGFGLLLLMAVSNSGMEKFSGHPLKSLAFVAAMATGALVLYVGYAAAFERRRVGELSLGGAGRELGWGLLVGAGLYAVCVAVLMALGVYRIEGTNPWTFVLPAMAMALSSGVFEELLFRGVLVRSLEDLFGSWVALVLSSLIFGFVHLVNPAATLLGALYISIEAGILLAAAYLLTRRLWLGIGFHMAWNYTQSAIFSGIVSGGVSEPGLLRSNIKGPDILTGGSFGLESSVVAFGLCTTAGIGLLIAAIKKGRLVPFRQSALGQLGKPAVD